MAPVRWDDRWVHAGRPGLSSELLGHDQRDQSPRPAAARPRRRPAAELLPLLRQRDFRSLLGARFTNSLAMSALVTVVGFQVYAMTGDPLALGWLGLVEAIPALSLVLFGGYVADRHDRRRIIVITSALVTACAAALGLLAADGASGILPILAVVFVTGIGSGFERPALTAFEAQVIPRVQAVQGVSYTSSVSQAGGILGPLTGGIALVVIGIAGTYAAMAVLLAISTVCLALIPRRPMPEIVAGEPRLQSLLDGIRYVRRTPALLGSMALDLFAVFFGGAIALLPVFATDVLHVGPIGLGIMRTAPSIGALGVMLIATRRPPSRHAGRTLLICVAGFGASMIVFGLSTTFCAVRARAVRERRHRRAQHGDPPDDPARAVTGADPGPRRLGELDLHRRIERARRVRERSRRARVRDRPERRRGRRAHARCRRARGARGALAPRPRPGPRRARR